MTVFRGLGDDVPDRLRRFIFPLEKNLMNREFVHWGGLHGMIEMIEGGTTMLVNSYYFEEDLAAAAKKLRPEEKEAARLLAAQDADRGWHHELGAVLARKARLGACRADVDDDRGDLV
jgi:cytosine/adenosine deaminase-related metal-dependent hydrolase